MKLDPLKPKYHEMYWGIAEAAKRQSVCVRNKVGAAIITPTGMISVGFNGMPSGMPNQCESTWVVEDGKERLKTNPEVIHAEMNALLKMEDQGVPTYGSILFTTLSPCLRCADMIIDRGIKEVYFDGLHDNGEGLKLLEFAGIPVHRRNQDA